MSRQRPRVLDLDGRLFPKLRLNPEGTLVTNKVTNVEIPIPNTVTLDFVSSYKLRKIVCTTYFNNIELVHTLRSERVIISVLIIFTVKVKGFLTCIAS